MGDTTLTLTILLVFICAGVVALFSIILVVVFIIAESHTRKKRGLDLKNHTANRKSYSSESSPSSNSSTNNRNISNVKDVESGIDSFPKISDPSLAEDILAKFVKPAPIMKAKVLFDFTAQQPGDLTIHTGEIITILKTNDSGWWVGESDTLDSGAFPYNYVELIKE